MPNGPDRSRFADLNRAQALAVGLLLCAAAGTLLFTAFAYDTRPPKLAVPEDDPASGDDFLLFHRLAEHVRAGENYHDAAFREMRAHRFPTGSPFNFRTPTYAWVLGVLPSDTWGRGLLMVIALAALVANFRADLSDLSLAGAVLGGLFLFGIAMWTWDPVSIYNQEIWASMLIALSLGLLGLGRRYPAIAVGVLALFFRELALPYCLLAGGVAFWHRRRLEAALWLSGVALYFLFLGWHAHEVFQRMTPEDQARSDWLCFGGLKFDLVTSRMSELLYSAPGWVVAVYLWLALIGLVGWRGDRGSLAACTVVAYLAAFSVVGNPYNCYWGLLYTPLLAFGLPRAPAAIADLVHAFSKRPASLRA
jgi:hypothetical protein